MYRNQNGFSAGPTFDLAGSRYADFSNTYRIGSYPLMGLRAVWEGDHWQVFGEVRNVLDKSYVGALSVRDQAAADAEILQPGGPRSVHAGIRYQF